MIRSACNFSEFSECKLVKDKKKSIISKITLLQQGNLEAREEKPSEAIEKKENSLLINSPDLNKLLGKSDLMSGKIMDADIADEWKTIICEFANENGIEIEEFFWNVGNLIVVQLSRQKFKHFIMNRYL